MSEDRDLMMQRRLMWVLEKQAPDGMVATRLAAAAKVSIDNTERLLGAAERKGIVTSFVNDEGRDAWKITPDPVPLKDIDLTVIEQRIVNLLHTVGTSMRTIEIAQNVGLSETSARELLKALKEKQLVDHADVKIAGATFAGWKLTKQATEDIDGSKPVEQLLGEEFREDDLRELLTELDPFDLPDGWTLLPPWTETAEWDLVYMCEWNGESVWQVCTMPGKRQPFSFMVTDIPHPDDPDETCTFEFDMDQAVRLLGFHLVRHVVDERREASE